MTQDQQINMRDVFDYKLETVSDSGQKEAKIETVYIPNSRNMND